MQRRRAKWVTASGPCQAARGSGAAPGGPSALGRSLYHLGAFSSRASFIWSRRGPVSTPSWIFHPISATPSLRAYTAWLSWRSSCGAWLSRSGSAAGMAKQSARQAALTSGHPHVSPVSRGPRCICLGARREMPMSLRKLLWRSRPSTVSRSGQRDTIPAGLVLMSAGTLEPRGSPGCAQGFRASLATGARTMRPMFFALLAEAYD